MNLEKLSGKRFLIANLILLGVVLGFGIAFFSFFFAIKNGDNTVQAEEPRLVVPQNALSVAESLQDAFRSISDRVKPSVVELKTVSVRRQQSPRNNGIPWEFFFGPNGPGQDDGGREFRSSGLGSGILVRKDKDTYYVLTNRHVVEDASEIVAALSDGKEYPATLVGDDSRKDLAVVSFKTSESYPLAVLGDSDVVKVGDWAIAIGNPLGLQSTVTMGIVSALGRIGGPGNTINDFIQTDASINQGNSGGALLNIRGEVIGINTWIASGASSGGSVGLGFAIPINNAKRSINEFIDSGKTRYGWLGVSLVDPSKEFLEALGVKNVTGAFASQVFIGSPADNGGIRAGDFITKLNGKTIRDMNQLTREVGDIKPGERAVFTVLRDGKQQEITVRIEERSEATAGESNKLWPGVMVSPLNDDIRSTLKLGKNDKGLYVVDVYAKSPAATIGIQRGDRITAINGQTVETIAQFYTALRTRAVRELWFSVVRNNSTLETIKYQR
jgi:Do/DeqQ family serine protease